MDVAKASATAQAIFSAMLPPGDCAVRSGTLPIFGHQKEASMSIARELSEAALNIRYDNLPTEGITAMGFHHGSVMPFAGAVIAGRLLGLDAGQMTNAMGIGASAAIGLGINDAEGEEYNNTKNIADGLMAERGVFAAYLARRGF